MIHFCIIFVTISCKNSIPAISIQETPSQVISFSLSRVPVSITLNEDASRVSIVDREVIRLLDFSGFEFWGRRLEIGSLQGSTFCLDQLLVWGEQGVRTLSVETGLLVDNRKNFSSGLILSIAGDQHRCGFLEKDALTIVQKNGNTTRLSLPDGKRHLVLLEDTWLIGGNGLQAVTLSTVPQWVLPETETVFAIAVKNKQIAVLGTQVHLLALEEFRLLWKQKLGKEKLVPTGEIALNRPLPLAFWGNQVVHGSIGLAVYSQDMVKMFSFISPEDAHIEALGAAKQRLVFARSDGLVEFWEGSFY